MQSRFHAQVSHTAGTPGHRATHFDAWRGYAVGRGTNSAAAGDPRAATILRVLRPVIRATSKGQGSPTSQERGFAEPVAEGATFLSGATCGLALLSRSSHEALSRKRRPELLLPDLRLEIVQRLLELVLEVAGEFLLLA